MVKITQRSISQGVAREKGNVPIEPSRCPGRDAPKIAYPEHENSNSSDSFAHRILPHTVMPIPELNISNPRVTGRRVLRQ